MRPPRQAPWFLPVSPRRLERHRTFPNTGSDFPNTLMAPSEKCVRLGLQGFCVAGKYSPSQFDVWASRAEHGRATCRRAYGYQHQHRPCGPALCHLLLESDLRCPCPSTARVPSARANPGCCEGLWALNRLGCNGLGTETSTVVPLQHEDIHKVFTCSKTRCILWLSAS